MMAETIYVESSGHECDTKLDLWLKDLLPRTPGLVRKVARRELILAAREFYERSLAWRAVVGPKALRSGKYRYRMSPYDAYANVVRVLGVEIDGNAIPPLHRQPTRTSLTGDTSTHYYLDGSDTVLLWPTPQGVGDSTLSVYVALTPKVSVTHLPRIAETLHYDALLDGVLGRLYAHPAKPYSNMTLGEYHLKRFQSAIASFKGMATQGYAGAQPWRFPRFGK